MITCAEAVHRLWAYLQGDLGAIDRAEVDAHLVRCRTCCGEVVFARWLQQMLASTPDPVLPAPVGRRLHDFLDDLEDRGWTSTPT